MNVSRIAFFTIVLISLQFAVATLLTLLLLYLDITHILYASVEISSFLVSICVFGYMSWTRTAKPYLTAFLIGILTMAIGVISFAIFFGNMTLFNPTVIAFDLFTLLFAVLIGVSLGIAVRGRHSANS